MEGAGSTAGVVAGDWFWPNSGVARTQNSDENQPTQRFNSSVLHKKCLARRKTGSFLYSCAGGVALFFSNMPGNILALLKACGF
jgi:hypothetical protein